MVMVNKENGKGFIIIIIIIITITYHIVIILYLIVCYYYQRLTGRRSSLIILLKIRKWGDNEIIVTSLLSPERSLDPHSRSSASSSHVPTSQSRHGISVIIYRKN